MESFGVRCYHLSAVVLFLFGGVLLVEGAVNNKGVARPPVIVYQMESTEHAYKDGEDVELRCMASPESNAAYEWRKDGQLVDLTLPNITRLTDRGGSFIIQNAGPHSDGVYQCFTANSYGTAVSLKTTLKKAFLEPFPTVTETTVHRPIVGSSLSLHCRPPRSYPSGNIYWGISRPGANQLKAIDNNARVVLSYEGHLFFTNVLASDSRNDHKYVCIANNPFLGAHVQGHDQRVEPREVSGSPTYIEPSILWSSPTRDVAIKGLNKKLKCIFAGLPTPTVTWERIDGPRSGRVHETAEGHGTEIEITRIEYEDGGVYRCSARNRGGSAVQASRDINLIVEAGPYWRNGIPPADKETEEENDVELDCQVDGRPKPTIKWGINGSQLTDLPPNPRWNLVGNKIVIRNASQYDRGIYQCVASNEHGFIVWNMALAVEASPPSFTATPTNKKIVEGQSTTLTCSVYGAPRPKVTWTKGTPPSPVGGGGRFIVHSNGNLELRGASLDDAGLYHCEAKNKFGTETASCTVTVRRPTTIEKPEVSDVEADAGQDVRLPCRVSTDTNEMANLVVEWRKNGVVVRPNGRSVIIDVDHSLKLKGSKVTDTAGYTCHATNGLDSATSDPIRVTVRDRPEAPRDVRIVSCTTDVVELTWRPSNDNNSPITEYVVYHTDSASDDPSLPVETKKVRPTSSSSMSTVIKPRPWTTYKFHVVAKNSIGVSDRGTASSQGQPAVCTTPQSAPLRNPQRVCCRLVRPTQLVIVWEPLPRQEHNAPGFRYKVGYRQLSGGATMSYAIVRNPNASELVIFDQKDTFQQYEILVQSVNDIGEAPIKTEERKIGYSGEGKPLDAPENLRIREDTLNSTYAVLSWDPVDHDMAKVRGFFRGYQIQYWREADQPRVVRTTDVIHGGTVDLCPVLATWTPVRLRRDIQFQPVIAEVNNLWPYSEITAGVLVLNQGNEGTLSNTITFVTPEGVPDAISSLSIVEQGSGHLTVRWSPPKFPNGIITSYVIEYQVGPPNVGSLQTIVVRNPLATTRRLLGLEPLTVYRVSVSAMTSVGAGVATSIEGKTVPASDPDAPAIGKIVVGKDSANVSWFPSVKQPGSNPGSEFYVEFIKLSDHADGLPWNRSYPEPEDTESGQNWANIDGLVNGEQYYFRVVAVNGAEPDQRETRSNPPWVELIGSIAGTKSPLEADTGMSRERQASADWFIILMCIIAFLLIILIIACILQYSRGQIYPVLEKERMWGHDPDAPEDAPFGEYTRNNEPSDNGRSRGSLDSDDKPIDSETDSLGEYEDQDPSKFNEDGSFIGQYTKRNQSASTSGGRAGGNSFV